VGHIGFGGVLEDEGVFPLVDSSLGIVLHQVVFWALVIALVSVCYKYMSSVTAWG
jgi:hypothetical protein